MTGKSRIDKAIVRRGPPERSNCLSGIDRFYSSPGYWSLIRQLGIAMSFDQAEVTAFYEKHPYSHRPTGSVSDAILIGVPSDIRFINHFVFNGRRDFTKPFRVLVAGGGTGDAVIGLGRQLVSLGCPAELVYIDLSARSREIAEQRASDIGLSGVRFFTGRIQDLPELAPGPYDYIDFCGVINHVGDQDAVLAVLSG
jgi:SAM-dependent methyltransferase